MLATQRLALSVTGGECAGVRTGRNRPEHGDIAVGGAHQPVAVPVAEVGGHRPAVHIGPQALGDLRLDILEAIRDAGLHRSLDCRRQAGRVEGLAGLQAEALEAGEGLDFPVAVTLLGKARVIEDQADPAQELAALQAARFTDEFHARIARIIGFAGNDVLGTDFFLACRDPLAERHEGDAVHQGVDRLQFFRRVIGQRNAQDGGTEVRGGLDDFLADELGGQLAAPVRPDQQATHRPRRIELAADHVPPARVVVHHLDAPVAVFHCRYGDDDRFLAQIEHGPAVQGGGVGGGRATYLRADRCAGQAQAIHTDETRAFLILRHAVAHVVDRHRVHAPEECFLGDYSGFFGTEWLFAWRGGVRGQGAEADQRSSGRTGEQGDGLPTVEFHLDVSSRFRVARSTMRKARPYQAQAEPGRTRASRVRLRGTSCLSGYLPTRLSAAGVNSALL
ncbi:hypothetical protein D9M71_346140 [compost metagenome]